MLKPFLICFSTFLLSCNDNSNKNQNSAAESNMPLKPSLQMVTKNLTARQFSLQTNDYQDLPYDRIYDTIGEEYVTTYHTYNPNTGNAIHKITLVHNPNLEEISINVKAVFGGVLAPDDLNYKIKATKKFKTSQAWGQEGFYRQLAGTGVPYETLVQYANDDFNYVNLLHIKSEDNHGERYWYILDEPIENE